MYISTILLSILLQSDVSNANLFNNYLMLGYGVMWLIGMVYVASLIMRQRNIQKDIQLMQQILQEDEQSG
jgi:CcmD family protein